MKFIIFLSLIGAAVCYPKEGAPYVWDLEKPRLDAGAVAALLSQKAAGQYPTYSPSYLLDSQFDCSAKKMPGYYADVDTQCQVYHRCDINGNMTSYICDNTTVFDQVTLICDYWFNVDCSRSVEFEEFANRRIYQTELPLFDTPPADYVAPQNAGGSSGQQVQTTGRKSSNAKQYGGGQVSANANARHTQGGGAARSAAKASGRSASAGGQAAMVSRTDDAGDQSAGYADANAQNQDQDQSAQDQSSSYQRK